MGAPTRATRDDWIQAGLRALERRGLDAIAVEPLARRLSITKGSFYNHFSSRDELIAAVLDTWRESSDVPLEATDEDPRAQLEDYVTALFTDHEGGRLFAQVCAVGEDPRVTNTILDVSGQRIRRLRDLLVAAGMDRRQARLRAELINDCYVGYWRINGPLPPPTRSQRKRHLEHLIHTLLPEAGSP